MKRILSISRLTLPLLALAFVYNLSAQTLVLDKSSLSFSASIGGSAVTQTVTVTSSTGAPINFTFTYPNYPWLKVNGQPLAFGGTTPATVSVTADPTGLSASTNFGAINVTGGSASTPPISVNFTVSAIGVSPASLAYTYTLGSTNIPTQNLTLSGIQSACTVVPEASGVIWFTVLGNCTSPGSLTVALNPAIVNGFAPNTYTGRITIAPSPGGLSPAVFVPLTLTVLPTPPVTVNPSPLLLNWQTGVGAPNPSAMFTISAPVGQSVSYNITQSGSLTNFSTITPSNGVTDPTSGTAQITYTVTNPSGLPIGTYTGKLTLFTPSATPTQQDIGITLVVSNTPLLNVPNTTLNFSYQVGGSAPSPQSVNVTSTGTPLLYAVTQSANSPWLSVPNAGTTGTPLTVSVNPAGLTPGNYSATVFVTSATPLSTPQSIPVALKVTNDPILSASVPKLSFPYQLGQSTPAGQSFKISSSTGAPLKYSASLSTTTCGTSWLQAANPNNSLTGLTDDTLTVSIATAGLTAGTCDGTITINATIPATGAAAVNSPLTIPVKLYVSATALLVATPANLVPFTVSVGAQSVAPQNINLSSTSSDVLTYTVGFQSNSGNWLFVGPQSGSTNSALTVSVIPTGLAAGSYSGTVTVNATGPGGAAVANSPVVIPVTLNVTGGSLTFNPATDLSFEQTLGGPAPANQTVTIGSTNQTLSYTAIANSNNAVNWLSVSPASGDTSSSGKLTVAVDGSKLTPGTTYNGTIVVTSPGAGNSPATINVHLKVNPGTISAPTTTLTFTQAVGGSVPAAQTIAVTGSPAPLSFTVGATTQTGANWLSATPASGTTPANVQVQVNGSALAVGQYSGDVTITSNGAGGSPITVHVVLNVVAAATLSATPNSLSYTYIVGQTVPAAQNLTVNASGTTVAVPLTAQAQVDGTVGQWLTVTPTTSVAPATFAVSVNIANLAAGTYNGRVVFSSANALVAATVPVTLTVTAIPKPVVNAVANAASYATGAVSPGEMVWISGAGLGPVTLTYGVSVNNAYPTTVANTRVLFDNVAVPIIYASATQTSVMVPYGVSGRISTNVVVEYFGVQSAPLSYGVVAAVPGIYTQNSQGTGPGSILNQDGVTLNSASSPEKRGNVISIYMTGEGLTNPQGVDGAVIPVGSTLKHPVLQVTATIGGVDATVEYAGSAPGYISGFMQVNVRIPLTAPTGTVPVVVTVGTAKSQSGASAATVVVSQ